MQSFLLKILYDMWQEVSIEFGEEKRVKNYELLVVLRSQNMTWKGVEEWRLQALGGIAYVPKWTKLCKIFRINQLQFEVNKRFFEKKVVNVQTHCPKWIGNNFYGDIRKGQKYQLRSAKMAFYTRYCVHRSEMLARNKINSVIVHRHSKSCRFRKKDNVTSSRRGLIPDAPVRQLGLEIRS